MTQFLDVLHNRIGIASLFFLIVLATVTLLPGSTVSAHQPSEDFYCNQAEQLATLSAQLDNEIKIHLRAVDGWRKLTGTNNQLHRRASAMNRRVDRNGDYFRLQKDIEKLQELSIELDSQFLEMIAKAERDLGRSLPEGDVCHVADRIAQAIAIADWMRAKCDIQLLQTRQVVVPPLAPVRTPSFVPEWQIAPAIEPPLRRPPAIESADRVPTLEAPNSVSHSANKIEVTKPSSPQAVVPASESKAAAKPQAKMHSVLE